MMILAVIVALMLVAFIAFSFLKGLIKLAIVGGIILAAFFIAHQAGAF
ncbi:MAG TPA: hypothetical protein VID20_07575 [Sphingomicrobium sp.]|jgi:hypothetical protein